MRQRLTTVPVVVTALVLSSCAGTGAPSGEVERSSTTTSGAPASPGSPASSSSEVPDQPRSTASAEPSSATEKLVLRRQIEFQVGGDGLFLGCQRDDEAWQEPPAPAVWMNTLYSSTEYPGQVVLCLKGFDVGQPISVTVAVGSNEHTVEVTPISGPPVLDENFLYEALPSETLFDGRSFNVYTEVYGARPVDDRDDGRLISETWSFVPPGPVRDELAEVGSFTIDARQGSVEASSKQSVRTPTAVAFEVLERTGTSAARRLVAYGYPAGTKLPVGLYRRPQRDSDRATLVGSIADVEVPPSRVAELDLEHLLSDSKPGFYCVAPPVEDETTCAAVEIWPRYPGRVTQGQRGETVRQWQEILIQAAIIADRASNRDGYFGPATAKAVDSYLENAGIPDPDGAGALGPQIYSLITS